MAIKDFSSGPQNYFEPGYFNGDYTEPNVSRALLQCDIDNVKGGVVITGEYYLGNYIDGTYYHDNSIRTTLVCEARIFQSAKISLGGYYQDGYLASGYFTQTTGSSFTATCGVIRQRNATATLSGSVSTTAIANVIRGGSAAITATFSHTATISHIEGADLFALSDAALLLTVARLRDHNCAVNSQFNMVTDFVVSRSAVADANAIVIAIVNALRSRDVTLDALAAFSIAVSVVPLQKQGASNQSSVFTQTALIDGVIQAGAVLVSTATQTTATSRTRDQLSVLTSTVSVNCLAINLQGYDIVATDFATVTCVAVKTVQTSSSQTVQFTQTILPTAILTTNSNLAVISNVFASKYLGSGRPRNSQIPPTFSEVTKAFGIASVSNFASLNDLRASASTTTFDIKPRPSQAFMFEAFVRHNNNFLNTVFGIGTDNTNSNVGLMLQVQGSQLILRQRDLEFNLSSVSSFSGVFGTGAFRHIAVAADAYGGSNNIAVWVNGTRVILTNRLASINSTDRFHVSQITNTLIDDVSLHVGSNMGFSPSSSTITVPESARLNDPAYTRLLWHYDNDNGDDITVVEQAQASLASASAVSAKLSGPQRLSASLTASSSLTALGGKVNSIDLVAFSNGALTATILRIKDTTGSFTSASSLSAVVAVVRNTDSAISSAATLTTVGSRTRFSVSTQSAEFTHATVAVRTASAVSTINALGILTTLAARTRFGVSSQDATFTQITQGAGVRFANSNQSAQFTQNTVSVKTANIVSNLNAQASLTATISHIEGADLVAFGLAAINATVSRTRPFESQVNVVTEITTNATKNTTNNSTISVDTVLTGSVTRIQSASVALVLTSSNTTQANVVLVSDVNMGTVATVTVSAQKTVNVNAGLSSPTQIITQAQVTRDVSVVLLTNSAVTCVISVIKLSLVTLLVASDHVTQTAVLRSAAVNFMVASVMSVIGNKFQGTVVVIDTVFAVSVDYERLRQTPVPVFSTVTVTVLAAKTVPALTTLVCDSNLACVISHIEGADLVSNMFATVSVSANKVMFGTAGLINTAVMSVAANELVGVTANTVCVATITVIGTRVQQAAATITAQHTVATVAEVTRTTVIALSAVSTVGCVISHIEGADIVINNFATVSVVADRVQSAASSMVCVSTGLITGSVSIQAQSSVAVISTVTVINITIKLATVNTVITGTVSVTAHCLRSATVSMSVTTVKLTVGTELRIDHIVYRIPAETRLYTIVSETRIHTIQGT